MTWHWAHKSLIDCDPWYEPESQWHVDWKMLFPADCQEVVVGRHRADVKTARGVIEFQRSHISMAEISEREEFYGDMVWILKGEDFEQNFDIRESSRYAKKYCAKCGLKLGWPMRQSPAALHGFCPACGSDKLKIVESFKTYWTFRWKHPRKSWFAARKPIGIDFDGMIFWVKKLYGDEYCAGWGIYQTHTDFVTEFKE